MRTVRGLVAAWRDAPAAPRSIVLVLSSSVKVPLSLLGASNGLRPGLAMLVKDLATQLGPENIRINALMPGRIATQRVAELDALADDAAGQRARTEESIPLRRYGEPQEFGQVAAFLLSPRSSYVTGAVIPVDGGLIPTI